MIAVLTIQKYAWRSFSSSGTGAAPSAPLAAATGPRYSSATSKVRGAAVVCGLVGAAERR